MKRFLLWPVIVFLLLGFLPKTTEAVSIYRPFGGRILAITSNFNTTCPAGFHIITVGFPKPITAIFTNVPLLVKNGPARISNYALGLALPPVPPCLPIVFLIGVSKLF